MSTKTPLNILGAGPGGLCAAIVLAQSGREVHVHERYNVIGKRFQGDLQGLENWTLPQEDVLSQLRRFGLQTNFAATPFKEVTLTDGKNSFQRKSSEPLFYLVKRGPFSDSLDTALCKQAADAGVKIHYRSKYNAEDADIVATGPLRRSLIAADKGIVFPIDHPNVAVGIFNDKFAYQGYSYLLISEGYGCLCSVVFNDFHRLNSCFENTLEIARKMYSINMDHAVPVGGVGGFSLHQPKQIGKACLVGEAAGLQDLLWGFGIRTALTSGFLAAESILEHKDYSALVEEKLTPFLKASMVNRYLWETIKLDSKPMIPMMMRLPFPLKSSFSFLYNFSIFHKLLYPFAERYLNRRYSGIDVGEMPCRAE